MANISKLLKFILFADDTNIFFSSHDINQLQEIVNSELKKLVEWFKINKLSLNATKSNVMLFRNKHKKKIPTTVSIFIDSHKLDQVSCGKFLGVLIDEFLTWNNHILQIEKKMSRAVGILYRAKNKLDTKELYLLYCTLVLPYLNYCSVIWGNNCKSRLKGIEVLQKRVIRIVMNAKYNDHTNPLFIILKCLKLHDLIYYNNCIFMFNVHNNNVSENVKNMFTVNSSKYKYNTRGCKNYYQNYAKSLIKNFSITIVGPKVWNSLSDEIKTSRSIFSFKNKLKKYIVKSYYDQV